MQLGLNDSKSINLSEKTEQIPDKEWHDTMKA